MGRRPSSVFRPPYSNSTISHKPIIQWTSPNPHSSFFPFPLTLNLEPVKNEDLTTFFYTTPQRYLAPEDLFKESLDLSSKLSYILLILICYYPFKGEYDGRSIKSEKISLHWI